MQFQWNSLIDILRIGLRAMYTSPYKNRSTTLTQRHFWLCAGLANSPWVLVSSPGWKLRWPRVQVLCLLNRCLRVAEASYSRVSMCLQCVHFLYRLPEGESDGPQFCITDLHASGAKLAAESSPVVCVVVNCCRSHPAVIQLRSMCSPHPDPSAHFSNCLYCPVYPFPVCRKVIAQYNHLDCRIFIWVSQAHGLFPAAPFVFCLMPLHIAAPEKGGIYDSLSFEPSYELASLAENCCCLESKPSGPGVNPDSLRSVCSATMDRVSRHDQSGWFWRSWWFFIYWYVSDRTIALHRIVLTLGCELLVPLFPTQGPFHGFSWVWAVELMMAWRLSWNDCGAHINVRWTSIQTPNHCVAAFLNWTPQYNVFQSLGASRSDWENVECKLRCINFRSVSDPRRAFRPAFRRSMMSDYWFMSTMGVIVLSLGTPRSAGGNFGCSWEHLGGLAISLGVLEVFP